MSCSNGLLAERHFRSLLAPQGEVKLSRTFYFLEGCGAPGGRRRPQRGQLPGGVREPPGQTTGESGNPQPPVLRSPPHKSRSLPHEQLPLAPRTLHYGHRP